MYLKVDNFYLESEENMRYQDTLNFLLNNSCDSIKYRIKRDILNESIETLEMLKLQKNILQEKEVQELIALQKEDGWIGGSFHGEKEPESIIRFLIEKGIECNNPVIVRALRAILLIGLKSDDGALSFGVGKKLDSYHLGGTKMVKSCVFAYAGAEEYDFVKEQICEALHGFEFILNIVDINQVCRLYKTRFYIFKEGMFWPSIYHLRLLAFTNEWKNTKNIKMLTDSLNNMLNLAPIPEIKLLHKGQRISPAKIEFINLFTRDIFTFSSSEWMLWFHWTELVARLGIINDLPIIKKQLVQLIEYLDNNNGMFSKTLSHYYFTKWNSYVGLSLDHDWKSKDNKKNNLTFRSLLILKYANLL